MMKTLSRLLFIVPFLIASTVVADPPARVVRLNLTEGDVSFRPAGIDDWTAAMVNRPLIDGDEVWTEPYARAELHIGSAVVRLGSSTSFGVINETDQVAQLRLSTGSMIVRIRNVDEDAVWEVDTPDASVSLLRPGRYRIDADGATTTVTTRGGEAEVTTSESAFAVHAGDQAIIPGADRSYDIAQAPSFDRFDDWCRNRDQREDRIASNHVPRDLVGYEDLDAAGRWRLVADYGWVWSPTVVVAGWAPYRYGHWAWVEPWGWTWIDDSSWGFAPFHYGRWAYAAGGWFWVPGRIVRPVYAPALVAFGGGPGWRASISIGAVAWWPLAPGEVYVPGYAAGRTYIRNINTPSVDVTKVNLTNINVAQIRYANQRVAGGVTAVPQAAFTGARPVAASLVAVSNAQALSASPIGMTAPLAPRQASVLGRSVAPGTKLYAPPAVALSRTVIAKTPPPPPPIAFTAKEHVLVQHPGQPLTVNEKVQVQATTPQVRTFVRPVTPVITTPATTTGYTPSRVRGVTTPVVQPTTGTAAVTNTVGQSGNPRPRLHTATTPVVQPSTVTTTSAPTTTSGKPVYTPPPPKVRVATTPAVVTTTGAASTTTAGKSKPPDKTDKEKEKEKKEKQPPKKD